MYMGFMKMGISTMSLFMAVFFFAVTLEFGALMIVNLSCGCLTPPYASVLYFGMKVGNAKFGEMMKNTLVFLLAGYVPVMLLTTYVEEVSLFLPRLLGYV